MITLYGHVLSADCYKVRLLLGLLGVEYRLHPVDVFPGAEQHSVWFRRISPLGEVPAIEADGLVLRDAEAILTWLAAKDPGGTWLPLEDATRLGLVSQWLGFARKLAASAGAARAHDAFGVELDVARARATAVGLFDVLDRHLWYAEHGGAAWLCPGDRPTIADVACFPDVMLSEEGAIGHRRFPAIRRWTERVRRLPGFVEMPGIFAAAPVDPG